MTALSPLSRALFKEAIRHAGLLAPIDPQVWASPWHVQSQATPQSHTAFSSLAPYGCKVAISTHRLVSLKDRMVTFPSRQVGSVRLRTPQLDVMELLRRCLQHVLPDGVVTVRHCGLFHASCAIPLATIRLMIGHAQTINGQPSQHSPPPPRAVRCPTCGASMRVVMRLWTSPKACIDPS